ncbi:DUF3883 domain-containing protein [Runella sp. CRIBMP]|uniref:DUF3883 domain-containing protein n=1 Tax=Runella sp. CRIBMP TaxID=2683261 RepID=UPI001412DB54|nr:DUF3883 domain-containing protein [Runella sp. CRIBMP]NBB22258.1 DUF3883 domain-containing protein [Runella sp. CRIBMP]
MGNNETCIHGGVSPISLLVDLHHSQAGSGRHRCPTCAYEQGFYLGSSGSWNSYKEFSKTLIDPELCQFGSVAPTHILSNLGENQGGSGRHKCTNCAFKQGFEAGVLKNKINEISIETVPIPTFRNSGGKIPNTPLSFDFIEKEIKNKHLGLLGELFILKSEIDFLKSKGKDDLADKVKHVSVEIGDSLGYDILSYDLLGNEKKIEVKTTRSDIARPFYLTKNEIDVSSKNPNSYYLYRLFDFDSNLHKGKCYIISGDLTNLLILDALVFIAYPKPNESK